MSAGFTANRSNPYNLIMASSLAIQLRLTKRSMSTLCARAKALGIGPGQYAKQLIEDALAMQRESESLSFAQIMQPVRSRSGSISDSEIKGLVQAARPKKLERLKRR